MPVLTPASLDETLDLLTSEPAPLVLAGGTDLMVAINAGRQDVSTVVSLSRVVGLREWHKDGSTVVLGAGMTYADLLHPGLTDLIPGLAMAARTVGSPQIRNAGTLGGNVATASPAGDTLPMLSALDASVDLVSTRGTRRLLLTDFLLGPKRTARRPDELIVAVRVPAARGPQEFLKVGTRNAMVISVVNLALVVDLTARRLGVGLGSVGPTVLRAPLAEAYAAEHIDWDRFAVADPSIPAAFGALVADASRPIDDHRSIADYRRHGVGVLATRALRRAFPALEDAA
jgi:CO/xanthine dehydrogenase FAD-binding subunit